MHKGNFTDLIFLAIAKNIKFKKINLKMFKIENCKIRTKRYPFIKPFHISGGVISDFLQLFCEIKIINDGKKFLGLGHSGISPVWSDKRLDISFADKEKQSVALAEHIAATAVGQEFVNPMAVFEFIKKEAEKFASQNNLPKLSQYVAMSPIDMAVWNAFSNSENKNIYQCLPKEIKALKIFGNPRDIYLAHTIGIGENIKEELIFAKKRGIKWFKVKLKGNFENDKNTIINFFAIFTGLNPKIILDGNEGYSISDLKKLLSWLMIEKFHKNIIYIEQPISRFNKSSIKNIQGMIPFFADEMVCDINDLTRVHKMGYQGIALKPTAKTFSETIKMLPLIDKLGLKISIADLTNCAPKAYPFHCEFAARLKNKIAGVEINSYKFVDVKMQTAILPRDQKHLFSISNGKIKTSKLK